MKNNSNNSSTIRYSPGTTDSSAHSSCDESLNNELISFSNYNDQFNSRASEPASLTTFPSLQPILTGPSHDYDLYRQQTGIPLGAFASTLAVNQRQYALGCGLDSEDEFLDLKINPASNNTSNSANIDLQLNSYPESPLFYPVQSSLAVGDLQTVSNHNPLSTPSTEPCNIRRLWPGIHQQQANAKARQKHIKKIQQHKIDSNVQNSFQNSPVTKSAVSQSSKDPIVEEKISQLLKSMRQDNGEYEKAGEHDINSNIPPIRGVAKRDEEMDEDERLLASEEGKKLSSKERRQLRNKVSARAFRSRRKEYINQLEDEIAIKTTENGDLRAQNQALREENTRLSDLTQMLISSPSFSGFIDALATNPAAGSTGQGFQQQINKTDQSRQNKDIGFDYTGHQLQSHYICTDTPATTTGNVSSFEHNIEEIHPYQPQVFFVRNIPEIVIDAHTLYSKNSPFTSQPIEDYQINISPSQSKSIPFNSELETRFLDRAGKPPEDSTLALLDKSRPLARQVYSMSKFHLPSYFSAKNPPTTKSVIDYDTSYSALKRLDRLFAETDACFKRLSTLTRHL